MQIGDAVPNLALSAYHNDSEIKINLAEQKGKWLVLVFYPADFTFICPTELTELAELYNQFKELGAEIMSVSADTIFVHKAWHDQSPAIKKVQYPMLADPTAKLCREFGTYLEDEGVSLRGTFIIDPDGKLQSMEVNANNIGRSAKEILRKLKACKFVRENKGQVCPASWEPGKETLTPGLNIVGKI